MMIEKIQNLPAQFTLQENEKRTVLVNKLIAGDINFSENSELTIVALLSEGWEEKAVMNFNFLGKHSKCKFIALIVGREQNAFSFDTLSNHKTPETEANYCIRGALFDKSKVDYEGNLIIKKEAQLTSSYLSHHTLMLSKDAKNNTTPSLEIEADDVQAGHAATVGKVDEDLLFYLESRGLKEEDATKILIKAFMEKDLEEIENTEFRKEVSEELAKLLA